MLAFVTSAGVFLERAIHAFIWSQGFSNRVLICVYYFGSLDFRTSDACIYPSPTFPTAFLNAYYFGSLVFRTSHTCIALRAEALRSSSISPDLARKIEGPLLAGYTCIYQFPTFPTTFLYAFSNRVACLFAFIVSARVFIERAIMTCLVPFPPQLFQPLFRFACF